MSFSNKIVLVTGASRGIGYAIAKIFAEQGAIVVGTATSEVGIVKVQEMLKQFGAKGKGIMMNVASHTSVESAWRQVQTEIGSPNIVVNNAGITRDNLMLRMKSAEWDDVMNTNLNSLYRITKMCLKPMIKARWGRIINISSIVGITGNAGQANYAAAKAGVIAYSKSLAQEVATRNVTVNIIAPGYIQTDMTDALNDDVKEHLLKIIPMQRVGTGQNIAHAVAFLASDQANYITGQTLHVNGGMYMS